MVQYSKTVYRRTVQSWTWCHWALDIKLS